MNAIQLALTEEDALRSEHYTNLGVEYHKESQKIFAKMLLFATLLLVSHALTIKPSEFDAAGIKIELDDIIVVHGALAFVFWYYLYMEVMLSVEGSSFLQMNSIQNFMRYQISSGKRRIKDNKTNRVRLRTPRELKRRARWNIGLYMAFISPFILLFFLIFIAAAILGAVDAYNFTDYLITKSGAYDLLDSL